MVSSAFLAVFLCGLALCSAQGQSQGQSQGQKPECSDEIQAFHECMHSSAPPPPKADFETIKKEADACFSQSGCTPPDQRFQGQNGPGGRAGPPNGGDFQCFRNVFQKVSDSFSECMKQKDPDFGKGGFPFPGGPGGPPPGGPGGFGPPPGGPPPGGPGGFGPPPGGPPHGGPGGFGPPPHGPPTVDDLANQCGGDKDKAGQLLICLTGVFDKHKPSKEEVKTHYDALCKAESTCKPKLGKCEEIMKNKGKAMCECHEQTRAKADEVFKQESTCANVQKPPFPGPPNGEKPDCSKPPPSPCEEGFDKFYERVSKFPPPPPPPQQ